MIYIFLADGFEECEALAPIDILRRGGVEIKTVGIGGVCITGAHGVTIKTDLKENDVILNKDLTAIILPGGMPGTLNLENSKTVKSAIDYMNKNNRLICAICAAPKILGGMGLLNGKNATCFPGYESELIGANTQDGKVIEDGNFITAKGPGAAFEFGFKILSVIKNEETAKKLKNQMQFDA